MLPLGGFLAALAWVAPVVVAAVRAAGTSWPHLRRRMSSQADVDEVSNR